MPESFAPMSKREILRVLFSRWLGILAIFIIVAGSVVLATLVAPKWYRSSITFQTSRPRPINPLVSPQDIFLPTEVFLRTQQAVILSEEVVSRALARLDGAQGQAGISAAAEDIRRHQRQRLLRQIKHIKVTTPVGENFVNSDIFYINVEVADDPSKAQQMTNLIAEEYRIKFDALQRVPLTSSTAILQSEVEALKRDFDQANSDWADFINNKIKGDLIALRAIASASTPLSVAGVAATFDQEVKTLQADLKEKSTLKAELDKELSRVANLSGLDPLDIADIPVVPERILKDNPLISALASKLTDLRLKAIELQPRYTNDFRERQNVAEEIRLTSKLLVDNLAGVSTSLSQEITTTQARLAELVAILDKDQAYMKQLSGKYVEYDRLQEAVKSSREEYLTKKDELKRAQTAESLAEKKVFLAQLDTASLPDRPIRPVLWINATVGVIVGLLLAIGYSFMADYYDHRFKTVEQAEQFLDLPVLGSVRDLGRRIIVRR